VARPAKAVAVELACRLSGITQRAIGAHYGGIGAAAVSSIHRKVQRADHAARAAIDALLPRLVSVRRRKIDNLSLIPISCQFRIIRDAAK
jgi:hypothetical protein